MPTPITNLHRNRIADQVERSLLSVQFDMRFHCTSHRQAAIDKSVPLDELQKRMAAHATIWMNGLQRIIDRRADVAKRADLVAALNARGLAESDIVSVVTALRPVAIAFRDAPVDTYADIIAACDAVLADVTPRDSLWPE